MLTSQRAPKVLIDLNEETVFIIALGKMQIQKQPPEVFCKKRCSEKFRKIHKKTPVPESLFFIKLQLY